MSWYFKLINANERQMWRAEQRCPQYKTKCCSVKTQHGNYSFV